MTHQELMNECDMLKGNINRMMVTDDLTELLDQYYNASRRIALLVNENCNRVLSKQKGE